MRPHAPGDSPQHRVEEGISKLALGHHFDDAVQTFFMNLFYGGKIGCFSPKTYLSRKKITVIRPLVFCEEREITARPGGWPCPL